MGTFDPIRFLISQVPLEAVQREVHRQSVSGQSGLIILALCAALLLALALILWLIRYRQQRIVDNPDLLFRELCSAHGVTWRQRQLLKKLVRLQGLKDPCLLWLDVELWDLEKIKSRSLSSPRQQKRISALKHTLFTYPN